MMLLIYGTKHKRQLISKRQIALQVSVSCYVCHEKNLLFAQISAFIIHLKIIYLPLGGYF